jgi:hypothetical protein
MCCPKISVISLQEKDPLPFYLPEWYLIVAIDQDALTVELDRYTQITFAILILGFSQLMYIVGGR